MGFQKRTYVKGVTTITADNLNEIQDAILDLEKKQNEGGGGSSEPGDTGNGIVSVEIKEV